MPRAGRVPVAGAGMQWLQLIPDGRRHMLTVKYRPGCLPGRLPRVSVWYADVIDRVETDPDGVAVFVDQYLDVIFSPQGDVHIDDREELDAAFASGELTAEQHARAVAEADDVVRTLCADMNRTEKWCSGILSHVLSRLDAADTLRRNV